MEKLKITMTLDPELAALVSELAALDKRTVSNWCLHQAHLAARAKAPPEERMVECDTDQPRALWN